MKPSIPKGTRDFSPTEMARRNFILDTITTVYKRYGFQQIETPAMENLSTLEGKYGEEGDKLLFRILNSGNLIDDFGIPKNRVNDFVSGKIHQYTSDDFLASELIRPRELQKHVAEKGLRYDLTVPFARYVVMHQNEITFPFKRFQVQPVWRADRPQKGRYREFYQCDADVIGSTSLLNEVELVQIIRDVFFGLGIGVAVKINNRKILSGIAEIIGEANKIIDITVAIDKLGKIGVEKVNEELKTKEVSESAIEKIQPLFSFKGSTGEKISFLKSFLKNSEIGKKGIEEIEFLFNHIKELNISNSLSENLSFKIDLDITLARGLSYYTGAIFEVKVDDTRSDFTGSLLGGGRYDDLTGIFGLPNISGVGISFGIDRIYDVMQEMKWFQSTDFSPNKPAFMFVNFGGEAEKLSLKLLQLTRSLDFNAEIYPDFVKPKKQFSYANNKSIGFAIIIGSSELESGTFKIKDLFDDRKEFTTNEFTFSLSEFEKKIKEIRNSEKYYLREKLGIVD